MRLEPLPRAEITLAPPQELGDTPQGRRRVIPISGPADVTGRLTAGEPVDASLYYMRTTPRFETGAERYRWLNGLICVASGARRAAAVELEVFAVQ